MRFLDIFNEVEKGNYALTDEAIYTSLQNDDELIPLYGGNKEHTTIERRISVTAKTKKSQEITIFSGEGIIISLDGSAGCMTYKKGERFALNHHAGFITVKNGEENSVDLRYFALFFQNHYKALAVSDGSKTLSLHQIYSEEFQLPNIEYQRKVINCVDSISNQIKTLNGLSKKIEQLLSHDIVFSESDILEKSVPLEKIVRIIQGHQITDEEIYNHSGNVPIFTGPNTIKGYWNKSIVNLTDLPCLTYATKAFDGTISLQDSIFDANNTAVMLLNDEYKQAVKLEWLMVILPNIFLKKATSKEGVSYLNKEIVNQIRIDIPKDFIQNKCIDRHKALNNLYNSIKVLKDKYYKTIEREIVYDF